MGQVSLKLRNISLARNSGFDRGGDKIEASRHSACWESPNHLLGCEVAKLLGKLMRPPGVWVLLRLLNP